MIDIDDLRRRILARADALVAATRSMDANLAARALADLSIVIEKLGDANPGVVNNFAPHATDGPAPLPSREALLGFVKHIASHPDIGDSLTAKEREKSLQNHARALLAGEGEGWGRDERR